MMIETLEARILAIILKEKFSKLMGRKSVNEVGDFFFFRIKVRKKVFQERRSLPAEKKCLMD